MPKWIHHVLWLKGWSQMLPGLMRGGPWHAAFAVQMLLVGITAVVVFPVGRDKPTDTIHVVASCVYILDHIYLVQFLGMTSGYVYGFWVMLAAFFSAIAVRKRIEHNAGVATAVDDGADARLAKIASLNPQIQRALWWAQLAVMLTENGVFLAFTVGIQSGL
jgi:hypothetical protein